MLNRRTLLGAAGSVALTAGLAGAASAAEPSAARSWSRLRRALAGDLVLPSDAAYEQARKLSSAQFDDVHPRAIAYCETESDVATCLKFVQDLDMDSSIRSGGHSFAGWSTSEGLVIDLSRINHIRASGSAVHLGPGAQAVDVVQALAPTGLSVPAGFCPTVCPGGFVTGGGMGWQFRKYGPTSDRLVSARVVLANGRTVVASRNQHEDLLWALRGGGGGNFGVVTDFELAPTRETKLVHFTLNWPWAAASTVLRRWQEWANAQSANLAPRAGLLMDDAKPGSVPKLMVLGVHWGSLAEANAALDELVGLIGSPPSHRLVEELAYDKAMMRQFGCENASVKQCHLIGSNPEAVMPRSQFVLHRSRMFAKPIPASGIDDMLAAFDGNRTAGQYRWLGFLSLGKNANAMPSHGTAYVHRDATLFAVYTVGLSAPEPKPEDHAAAVAWSRSGFAAMDPHSNGRTYVNYPDEALTNWRSAYYGDNYAGLVAVRRRYDPHRFFRSPHAVAN